MKNPIEIGTNKKREWRAQLHELAATESIATTCGPIYAVTYQLLVDQGEPRRVWATSRFILATLDLDEAIREAEDIELAVGERIAIYRYNPLTMGYPADPAAVGFALTPALDDPQPETNWENALIASRRNGEAVTME